MFLEIFQNLSSIAKILHGNQTSLIQSLLYLLHVLFILIKFIFFCLHFFFAGLFFKLVKPNVNEAATSELQFFDNFVRIIFATNLLKGMLSLCRGIVPKRVCAIVVRRLCSVMNGSIVHDENNQLFFVELNNDGGRPKCSAI